MSDPRPAHITISRTTGIEGSYISITLTDGSSHCQMLRVRMDFAEFAEAVTGHGHQPCTYEVNSDPAQWGLTREHKEMFFDKPLWLYDRGELRTYLSDVAKPYEIDGWEALVNLAVSTQQNGKRYRVVFERYVQPEGTSREEKP